MPVLRAMNLSPNECSYIHRGRNRDLSKYFLPQCCADYTYDYRGIKRFRILNSILGLIKALIFSLEVDNHKYYLLEGGMFIWIGIFLKLFNPRSQIIMNIADPTLAVYRTTLISRFKRFVKLKLISRFSMIVTNSPIIEDEVKSIFPTKRIYRYYLPLFEEEIKKFSDCKREFKKNILFLITRPKETGLTKGLDIFYEMVKHPDLAGFNFIVGGAGTELLDLSGHKNVQVHGHIYDVSEAFKLADILVVPSFYDAYPSVSIECFAFGVLPIVSAGSGSWADLKKISDLLVVDDTHNIHEWTTKIKSITALDHSTYCKILNLGVGFINQKFRY